MTKVIVVRIYFKESEHKLKALLHYLHDQAQVRGATVFRGIAGFGEKGMHENSLVDLSLDLPMVLEFFDEPARVETVLDGLKKYVTPEHIITLPAEMLIKTE